VTTQPRDPETASPSGFPTADLLADIDVFGPSWDAMSGAQRERRGPALVATAFEYPLAVVADLLEIVVRYPRAIEVEGIAPVVHRRGYDPRVIDLAAHLDRYAEEQVPAFESETEQAAPVPRATLDDITAKRVMAFAATVGRGYKAGQRLAAFLLVDLRLADETAMRLLVGWNEDNRYPLSPAILRELLNGARPDWRVSA
jgi:hypothetical protein